MSKRKLRLATVEDLDQLDQLIKSSSTDLCHGFYSSEEVSALNQYLFGVNRFLIDDKTYFVIEDQGTIVACGGWSKRSTVFGGDQFSTNKNQWLDPQHDPAKIRAFFVHPDHVRQGLASILMIHCENESIRHGFERLELMATLSGVDLYLRHGFNELRSEDVRLPNGLSVMFKPMLKGLLQHRELTTYQIDLETPLNKQTSSMLTYFSDHKKIILAASMAIAAAIASTCIIKPKLR